MIKRMTQQALKHKITWNLKKQNEREISIDSVDKMEQQMKDIDHCFHDLTGNELDEVVQHAKQFGYAPDIHSYRFNQSKLMRLKRDKQKLQSQLLNK